MDDYDTDIERIDPALISVLLVWYQSHDLQHMHAMRPILSLCNMNDLSELSFLASSIRSLRSGFCIESRW